MARIAGIDLPKNKKAYIGLTYIYGIGQHSAYSILEKAEVDPEKKINDLSEEEVAKIRSIMTSEYKVEGALRSEVQQNIKRLMDIGAYRGLRHRRGLPARGQRTRTNSRTRKGKRRTVAGKKKAPGKK
ncbi:MAG: 30S ribosomal protein S13 [Melioribacteraceae bacterium]|nr:MAG: 30S ribosomal protein S13 [Melioribacteraceae bacterium]